MLQKYLSDMEEELNATEAQPSSQASLPSEKSERGDEANRSLDMMV